MAEKKFDYAEYYKEYKKEHYEQIIVRVKKGDKERYKQAAADAGMTLNGFIGACIESYLERRQAVKNE